MTGLLPMYTTFLSDIANSSIDGRLLKPLGSDKGETGVYPCQGTYFFAS
jgi:hypothetical protein